MLKSLQSNFKYLFLEFLQLTSNRVKLIWATFTVWFMAITWFMVIVPAVREFCKIKDCSSINLQTSNDGTILAMVSAAFGGTVISYVSSKWNQYSGKVPPMDLIKQNQDSDEDKDNSK